jgi:hypothetical protein
LFNAQVSGQPSFQVQLQGETLFHYCLKHGGSYAAEIADLQAVAGAISSSIKYRLILTGNSPVTERLEIDQRQVLFATQEPARRFKAASESETRIDRQQPSFCPGCNIHGAGSLSENGDRNAPSRKEEFGYRGFWTLA